MVDRLLSVDEHLDILHKEKVSRTEVGVSRNVSPERMRTTSVLTDPSLQKQRTTFVGPSGIISSAKDDASLRVPHNTNLRPRTPPINPDLDLSRQTQKEIDTLRVRELEKKLGIGYHLNTQ